MTIFEIIALAGLGFLIWEVQSFLRNSLKMKWQEIHILESIRQQLENIEMTIRGNQPK